MVFNIINLTTVGSTNSYAQELISSGTLNEGDVIFTHNQDKGRGQGGNLWESESGSNLTFSLILEPKFIAASQQFVLTQLISLAIASLLKKYLALVDAKGIVKIKWPNDIYIDDKKICGILFQNIIVGNVVDFSIVGIGINVNQDIFYSNAKNPTSLIHYFENNVPINEILENLLSEINLRYENFRKEKDYVLLKNEYLSNLYQYNQWYGYKDKGGKFYGSIVDVDDYGRLIVVCKNDSVKQFLFKEVEFIGEN